MKDKIKKLDKNIIPLIFNEIIKLIYERVNKNEEFNEEEEEIDDKNEEFNEEEEEIDDKNDINYNEMKEYIFSKLINKIENMSDINNIITFLDKLEQMPINEQKKDRKIKKESIIHEFLNELIEKNLFNKDEFFSNKKNIKILLLYKLYEKGKIKKNEEYYYDNIINLFKEIWKDIDGNIQIKKLEEFLKNDESIIKQRLSLLKILDDILNPEDVYRNLKRENEKINDCKRKIIYIKDNIIIYLKEKEKEVIKKLIEVINNYQNIKISEIEGEQMKELFKDISRLEERADIIEKVKNFLLFNVIYDMDLNKDEENSFIYAYNKLYEIGDFLRNNNSIIKLYTEFKDVFDIIKEKLGINEERAQKFITDFIKYYNINNDNLIDELTTCTGITQYKIYISMTPTTISGNYTKEKIVKEKLNHFQKIYIYIRGMDKIDEENFQTYFKYDLNLPINLLEIQGNGKQLIDCCTLIIKENKLAKDSLETSLKIEKESEQDIICNLTIKELVILSKKINQPQLNTLNKAINHCIENKENYNNPKQMRKEK